MMRAFKFVNLAILSALVATSAALYAQDEKQENKPPRQEEPKREPKQDEMKAPRQDEAKPSKQERQSGEQMKPGREEHAQPGGHARPAGKSAHIPDEKFRAQFGRTHTFKAQRPQIVEGQPQFVYGGYSFVLVDPWPMEWAYTDDVYIDYVDGDYFLYDLTHPGVRIALFVVM